MKRACIIALGAFLFFMGILGLFIPVFPTVPFMFLAVVCFMKTSVRFRTWVKSRGFYKKYFSKYEVDGHVPFRVKLHLAIYTIGLIFVSLAVGIAVYYIFLKNEFCPRLF